MNSPRLIPVLFSVLTTAAPFCGLFAQAGSLDLSFDVDGKVTTDFLTANNEAWSVAIQPDGKIVAAGYVVSPNTSSDFAVMRYLPDGSLDPSFGIAGGVATDFAGYYDQARAVALQADGKIVVAGIADDGSFNTDFAVVRYLSNGDMDTSFSGDGRFTADVSTGAFNTDGARAVAIQPDGKIVVAGVAYGSPNYDFAVLRLNTDGTLDDSFSSDGMVITDVGTEGDIAVSIAVQTKGMIVVAGWSFNGANQDFAVVRYSANGTLDNSFGSDGMVTTDIGGWDDMARSVALGPGQKIVVVGYTLALNDSFPDFSVVRYNWNGSLDTTFGSDGMVLTDVGANEADDATAVVHQPDGKIVVAGAAAVEMGLDSDRDFAVVRYHADGSLDLDFSGDGMVTTAFGFSEEIRSVALQPNGAIVVAGYAYDFNGPLGNVYDFALARYLSGMDVGLIDLSGRAQALLVYPNPIEDETILQYALSREETISIRLLDLHGSVLHTFLENRVQGAGEHQQKIALPEGLASGAYMIVVSSLMGQVSIRIVR